MENRGKEQMNKEHEIVLYQLDNTSVCVSVFYKDETFWLTQRVMADLFDCSADNISLHLKNIFSEEELDEKATTEDFSVVQEEGTRNVIRKVKCYNFYIAEVSGIWVCRCMMLQMWLRN